MAINLVDRSKSVLERRQYSDGSLAIRNMLPRIQNWHKNRVLWRGGPDGFFGEVKLSPSAQARVWTFQVKMNDRNFPNNYVATSIILLDDRGNGSNQLNVWIDFANGRLLEGGALTEFLVGKWVNEMAEPDWSRKIIATFNNDGTYLFQGKRKNNEEETSINEKGTWKVADGTLEMKPENPVANPTMPSGSIIFEINDMTFKSCSENSPRNYEWKRVKE